MLDANKVYLGDNLDVMKNIEDNSVDSVVTDPPYAISMMSKKWDSMSSKEFYDFNIRWLTECYRVLKPGGYILAFGHSRMSHRLACAVEDVGFEIRDSIAWLYSSGMPKSLNIGKAVDKLQGNKREVIGNKQHAKKDFKDNLYFSDPANKNNTKMFGYGEEIITKGNSEWEGWGTSLKPMFEPIIVGRKPLAEKSVAENVLKYGTGGINIDNCRIPINREIDKKQDRVINRNVNELNKEKGWGFNNNTTQEQLQVLDMEKGRFPGNVILDEYTSEILDKQIGNVSFGNSSKGYTYLDKEYEVEGFISKIKPNSPSNYGDNGGASRFFYCAKASPKEKNLGMGDDDKNNHISVKPLTLMKYLIRLVTNKNGICLDPFIGSGTTGCACIEENIKFIGIEQDENYFNIANKRIYHHINDKNDILSEFI